MSEKYKTIRGGTEPPGETNAAGDLPEGDGALVVSPQGWIMASTLQAERILGQMLTVGQVVRVDNFLAGPDAIRARQAFREALEGGHSHARMAAAVVGASGRSTPVTYSIAPLWDEEHRIIGVVWIFRDETEVPVGAGPALPAGGVDYDALVENMAEGVFTINTRWRITSFNLRAREITGFKSEEVLGRHCWEIFKSDLCRDACPLRATLETGATAIDQDVRIVSRKGRPLTILVNTSVIRNDKDMVIGAVETFRPTAPAADRIAPAGTGLGSTRGRTDDIIGQSPALTRVLAMLPDVAASDASVLIEGASGTGKEMIARAIHAQSPRNGGPFIAVNCSALAETLLESELFGHEKAAFTGAISSKAGRFEVARGGTLFLDEIAEIKPEIQVKLLRVLEARVFERVGGTRSIPMDARIIAATNRRLISEVRAGRFREDLFYRLHTVPIRLPRLEERKEDLALLVGHFTARFNRQYRKQVRGVDPKVMSLFRNYSWPGNIRELERVMEYAFVFVKGPVITRAHLPELEDGQETAPSVPAPSPLGGDERQALVQALAKTGGRRGEAARLLGISRSSLWRKMKAHKLLRDGSGGRG